MNLLAFLIHNLFELMDQRYTLLRKQLGARKNFFNDIRALTRYLFFDSWDHLIDFMMQQLELEIQKVIIPPNEFSLPFNRVLGRIVFQPS